MKFLLDMDGVIVDFISPACQLFNLDANQLIESGTWQPGEWDLWKAWNIPRTDFYGALDKAGGDFWINLQPYPWAYDLYSFLSNLGKVYFCTAPILHHECAGAKIEWLRSFTNKYNFNDYIITKHKELLARHDCILIDDSDTNINAFRASQGTAIIFPAHWNSRHLEKSIAAELVKSEVLAILG